MNEDFQYEVADTILSLINEGITDPHAEEILDAHYDGKSWTSVMLASLKDELPAIKNVLCESFNLRAHIVNSTYYDRFRGEPVSSPDDAQLCICGGPGRGAQGIRIPTSNDDLILQATFRQNLKSAQGKEKKTWEQTYKSWMAGEISDAQIDQMIKERKESYLTFRKVLREARQRGLLNGELFEDQPAQPVA